MLDVASTVVAALAVVATATTALWTNRSTVELARHSLEEQRRKASEDRQQERRSETYVNLLAYLMRRVAALRSPDLDEKDDLVRLVWGGMPLDAEGAGAAARVQAFASRDVWKLNQAVEALIPDAMACKVLMVAAEARTSGDDLEQERKRTRQAFWGARRAVELAVDAVRDQVRNELDTEKT